MQTLKHAVYIGNFDYPEGNAAGKRVQGNVTLLKSLGYKVTVIYSNRTTGNINRKKLSDSHPSTEAYVVPYPQKLTDWLRFVQHFNRVKGILDEIEKVDVVIIYSNTVLSIFNTLLINYCRRQNIKVLADVVDWLSIKTNSTFYNVVKRADEKYQKSIANVNCDGIICISSYFQNYYNKRGVKTILLPPLSSTNHTVTKKQLEIPETPTIVYAGNPFRRDTKQQNPKYYKDRIDLVIKHLATLRKEGLLFALHVYGLTKNDLIKAIPNSANDICTIGSAITFHGTRPNTEIIERVRTAHFTILIRDSKRETIAGFPTKVSESISLGTPVIVTTEGDAPLYIKNGKTGFLLNVNDEKQQITIIRSALTQSRKDTLDMKHNCTISNAFTPSNYSNKFRTFLDDVIVSS